MYKSIFIVVFIFFNLIVFGQLKRDYDVYQFLGNDSLNQKLCKIVNYNNFGQLIFEESIDFKYSRLGNILDYVEKYYYKDSLLFKIERTFRNLDLDGFKEEIIFVYNSKIQLKEKIVKKYDFKLKNKSIKKGAHLDDFPRIEENYTKKRIWQIVSITKYIYSKNGKMIYEELDEFSKYGKEKITYEYDYDERMIKESHYNDNRLQNEKFYSYYKDGSFDYISLSPNSYDFNETCRSVGKVRYFYNEIGLLKRETRPDDTGIRADITFLYYYNQNNEMIKKERYDVEGRLELTYIYKYK